MLHQKPELTFAEIREIMNAEEKQLATINPAQLIQISTDVAAVCGEIVRRTALSIKGKHYVRVEGWQAIASAHGCIAGCREVERVDGGVRAMAELRRISDGALLAVAEGFVGKDELVWYGGQDKGGKTWPRRHQYAIRAMAQTRAISRVCRSAFAHVVVLIDANLSTTPAEEIDSPPVQGETERPFASSSKPVKHGQEDLRTANAPAPAVRPNFEAFR